MNAADEKIAGFERRARERLSRSADALDAATRSKLTQARYAAVEAAGSRPAVSGWRVWVPAGSVAGAAALAVLLWTGAPESPSVTGTAAVASPLDDLEIMVASESFEMLEELEFYDWVESAAPADSSIG